MNPKRRLLATAMVLTALTACARESREQAIPIPKASRVMVFVHSATTLAEELDREQRASSERYATERLARTIDDPTEIEALRRFANRRLDDWGSPQLSTPPIPTVEARFYNVHGVMVGTFGAGPRFFARGAGAMRSRPASEEEVRRYLDLLGITEDVIRRS